MDDARDPTLMLKLKRVIFEERSFLCIHCSRGYVSELLKPRY